jgi:hypothetical protein
MAMRTGNLKGTVQECVTMCMEPSFADRALRVATICMEQGPGMAGHLSRPGPPVEVRNMAIERMQDPATLVEMARGVPRSPFTYREYVAQTFVEGGPEVHKAVKRGFQHLEDAELRFLGYLVSPARFYIEATFPPLEWHAKRTKMLMHDVPDDFEPSAQKLAAAEAALAHYHSIEL